MQKIVPHLWFDTQAKEASEFYVSVFGQDSKINSINVIKDTPSGDCDIISFKILGLDLMAISAGPYFKINPSISFMVNFDPSVDEKAKEKIDEVWQKLIDGGKALMEIGKYPFSERYGWVEDKFGVSWQLILTNPEGEQRPKIMPSLLFVGDVCGKAEEASNYYISLFSTKGGNSKRGAIAKYPAGMEPDKEGSIMFTDFTLAGQWFVAMDSAREHKFKFSEAISFIVNCESQEEVDFFWEKLSKVPEAEQCGWLKDQYGVSWQIVPTAMNEMLGKGTSEQKQRLTKAFLQMKKFDIKKLEQAFKGE
jgi:predicted 3-demethylubiquinone-9 3-methyltransferase (glyoxalase superfamily)